VPVIAFCEEYPTEESLAPARLITAPAIVFLAAERRDAFDRARDRLAAINPRLGAGWWLVPHESRALSAFCDPLEVAPLADAVATMAPGIVLLDLELPVWNPRRLLRDPRHLADGRRAVDVLFRVALARHEVWTAEWPPWAPATVRRWLRLCLPQARTRVYMLYSSMLPPVWRRLLIGRLRRRLSSSGSAIGVGALATGVAGNEPLLSPSAFAADLDEAAALGVPIVLVYRLAGLDERHVPALASAADRPGRGASASA
jgi:hypothetical protein